MFLRSVDIRNYLSLEQVRLESLGKVNVLIGRNNAGKSAVFGALSFLGKVINNHAIDRAAGEELAVLTARDPKRSLEIRLVVELRERDRREFLDLVLPGESNIGRREAALNSPFLRKVEYTFRTPVGVPRLLHLHETRLIAEDGEWARVQKLKHPQNVNHNNPTHQRISFHRLEELFRGQPFGSEACSVDAGKCNEEANVNCNALSLGAGAQAGWFASRLARHLAEAFFFNPFRHCTGRIAFQEANRLLQDGANLAQVLATILGRNRRQFEDIEQLVKEAIPDLGRLQTPPKERETEVGFLARDESYFAHIHDMGGGIEQLLMVMTVLLTTDEMSSLFLEEPESHLHPGAQRFLMERLRAGERQVFLTTHSPILLNAPGDTSIYRVTYMGERTEIARFNGNEQLGILLEDIGARNSDVLLSDAVLFVEGPGDKGALNAWSKTLGTSLAEHNVTVLSMGGGEYAGRTAPVRGDVLAGISQRAPVPHLFVLDADERGAEEINGLRTSLGGRSRILKRRELENYLLVPRAIRAAVRSKRKDSPAIVERVDATTDTDIEDLIRNTAEGLYPIVLLKRIRTALRGLPGGLLPRDALSDLVPHVNSADLPDRILEGVEQVVKDHVRSVNIPALVASLKTTLDAEWADRGRHAVIAPGEDILAAVFEYFGTKYTKPADTVRLAAEMRAEEIDAEIAEVIKAAIGLTSHAGTGQKASAAGSE